MIVYIFVFATDFRRKPCACFLLRCRRPRSAPCGLSSRAGCPSGSVRRAFVRWRISRRAFAKGEAVRITLARAHTHSDPCAPSRLRTAFFRESNGPPALHTEAHVLRSISPGTHDTDAVVSAITVVRGPDRWIPKARLPWLQAVPPASVEHIVKSC